MDYLSTKEVAGIKQCSVQNIKKLCKDGKLGAIQQPHPQNKCMCYMIPVSALSEQEQARYYKKIKQEAGFIPAPAKPEKEIKTGLKYNLKSIQRPFESFSFDEREQIAFWTELLNRWQAERNAHQGVKTEFDKIFASHQKYINPDVDVSPAILYRKLTAYQSNCLEGLIDNRGGWNKGKSKLDDDSIVWKCFLQLYLDDCCKKVTECLTETKAFISEEYPELIESIPSLDTFRRKIKKIPFAILEYTRNGEKAMKDHCIPHAIRLKDNIYANTIWVMDNYTFDILCKNEDGVTETKRFYLTGVLDAKSGVFVGWNISDSPDSQSTIIALRNAIRRYGIPDWLYFDNGREFTAKDLTGDKGARLMAEMPIPPSIISRLGIKVKFAIVHNAQAKEIERAHLTFKNQFCKNFMGWCGGNILERRESLKRHIKNGVIETETELRGMFEQYADYVYNVQSYGGEEKKYKSMTRIDVWNQSIKQSGMVVADESTLNLLMMRTNGYQKIKREGVFIKIGGEKFWYYDKNIAWQHIGEEVYVRYDPCCLSSVRIYDKDDRYLWTWKMANELMLDYIEENSENIAIAQTIKGDVKKQLISMAKEVNGKPIIMRKDGLKYVVKQGRGKFAINMPKDIQIVTTEEPLMKKAVGAEDISAETVEVNINKLIGNAKKRKGK